MTREIPVAQLSKVFQDAMRVTLELGLSYIWIGSLCIIQDSDDLQDWKEEAPKMGDVYGQAALGIAANGFKDGQAGLFRSSGDFQWASHSQSCVPVDWRLGKVLPNLSKTYSGLFAFGRKSQYELQLMCNVDKSPLYKRGWASQERILSPRVLHFCTDTLYWECEELVANGNLPAGFVICHYMDAPGRWCRELSMRRHASPVVDGPHKMKVYDFWLPYVQSFSRGRLSVAAGRLPASGGIAQICVRITGDRYVSGCWLGDMDRALLWSLSDIQSGAGIIPIPHLLRAPSWSWTSVN